MADPFEPPPDFESPPLESPAGLESAPGFESPPDFELPPAPQPPAEAASALPSPPAGRCRRGVVFVLGCRHFAVDASQVAQVEILGNVVPLPHVPSWILGVSHLRGEIVTVIDLRPLLDAAPQSGSAPSVGTEARILVIRAAAGDPVAFVVDQILGVREVGTLLAAGPEVEPALRPHVRGLFEMAGARVYLTDLSRVLESTPFDGLATEASNSSTSA